MAATARALKLARNSASLDARVRHYVKYVLGTDVATATPQELLHAVSLAVRDEVIDRMGATAARQDKADPKRAYYLSIEFLMGRALGNTLYNLGIHETWAQTLNKAGIALDDLLELEPDAALGNGGLGRLAACFLDSMATLDLPGFGYGLNYEFGLFRQRFDHGFQQECPDRWGSAESPWLIQRQSEAVAIPIYGRVEHGEDREGAYNPQWLDWNVVVGVPSDMPLVGYGGNTVNWLRLFAARAADDFDMRPFNQGDYVGAVNQKIASETISKVLYPSDDVASGRELRLTQEYFLVACALRDIVRRYKAAHSTFDRFADKVAIQLNDTHPALAVPELMRYFVDEVGMPWDQAWGLTESTFGYTNHTLLPEALEKWPVDLVERVLPRHMQIIYEINRRFLDRVISVFPHEPHRAQNMSLIEEGPVRNVRMANLSIVGSHSVNGVAAMHSELVKTDLVPDFYALWPERFGNKTNGITPRRWLLKANPELSALLFDNVGAQWPSRLDDLRGLERHADDPGFQEAFGRVKQVKKAQLARVIYDTTRVRVDPAALFDVQAKRIHEYKRQLLNALHIAHLYLQVADHGRTLAAPRVCVFAGKAAPGYALAKLIIRLINGIAEAVNNDGRVNQQLRVAFLPDYRVSLAERIIPGADLSEQISTAGKEASGTGNMKFALNGALTIGTLDGANVEIAAEVGNDNIYIFGLTVDEIARLRRDGYDPRAWCQRDDRLGEVIEAIASGRFSGGDTELFAPLLGRLLHDGDEYMHCADFGAYVAAQERVGRDYVAQDAWRRRAILNVARVGTFSSDRTIAEYATDIWNIRKA
jgi:starch phosphorylase